MEVFAILGSFPAAFIATAFYRLVLLGLVVRFQWIAKLAKRASYIVFALLVVEVILLLTLGAIQSRRLIGPVFSVCHLALFFLGTPALANVLILRHGRSASWVLVSLPCAALAVALTLMQYAVSDELFGIDGIGGPYS
jgi:hypothetical protein